MVRNAALHTSRGFVPPKPTARTSTSSNVSALSSNTATSIATTPANQLGDAFGARLSGGSNTSTVAGAAPCKPLATVHHQQGNSFNGTPLETPSNALSIAAHTGGGQGPVKTLNFSGLMESPVAPSASAIEQQQSPGGQVAFAPTTTPGGALCHCPRCNIQIISCMQCTGPLLPGPLGGALVTTALPTPNLPTAKSAFAVFKEEYLKKEPKTNPLKVRLQNAARLWSACSDTEKAEYGEKAKQLHVAAVQAATTAALSVGRGKRDRDATTTGTSEKEKVKRPLSGYMKFTSAKRSEVMATLKASNPDHLEGVDLNKWVFKESAGRLSAMWKTLSEEDKVAYKTGADTSAAPSTASSIAGGDDDVEGTASEVEGNTTAIPEAGGGGGEEGAEKKECEKEEEKTIQCEVEPVKKEEGSEVVRPENAEVTTEEDVVLVGPEVDEEGVTHNLNEEVDETEEGDAAPSA